jgi:hypothetical protein
MATRTDLWGDIEAANIRTPVAILREQASVLGEKTRLVIDAQVSTVIWRGDFVHHFKLVVPALEDYTYELFDIRHGVGLYPVFADNQRLENEEKFIGWLRDKLSSPETKRIISNLLAQANS